MVAFSQVLRLLTPKEPKYHSARWLLNVTAMTLGTFPEAVPTNHRIQLDRVTPQGDRFPAFPNIAQKAGVNSFNLAGGAIADDFNGDGWIDIHDIQLGHTGQKPDPYSSIKVMGHSSPWSSKPDWKPLWEV